MAIKGQGELLTPTDIVNLTVQVWNNFGMPVNADMFPSISIIQPSGLVALAFTSAGVQQIDVGKYVYQFSIPYNGPYGAWCNIWQSSLNGVVTTNTLQFIVENTQLPKIINSDGYGQIFSLGDDPGFNYSQIAIRNINKLLKSLKARLNNDGKAQSTDAYGNVIYIDCNVFSIDMLVTFLATALTDFNQVPYFTFFTFDDTLFIEQFLDIIVEGATLTALASQALIEVGRQYTINDNGVSFTPPSVSELLQTQYSTLITQYYDKLKYIKNSMRPRVLGLGSYTALGANPIYRSLRSRRERQIF